MYTEYCVKSPLCCVILLFFNLLTEVEKKKKIKLSLVDENCVNNMVSQINAETMKPHITHNLDPVYVHPMKVLALIVHIENQITIHFHWSTPIR